MEYDKSNICYNVLSYLESMFFLMIFVETFYKEKHLLPSAALTCSASVSAKSEWMFDDKKIKAAIRFCFISWLD